jgi:hypothetical protein
MSSPAIFTSSDVDVCPFAFFEAIHASNQSSASWLDRRTATPARAASSRRCRSLVHPRRLRPRARRGLRRVAEDTPEPVHATHAAANCLKRLAPPLARRPPCTPRRVTPCTRLRTPSTYGNRALSHGPGEPRNVLGADARDVRAAAATLRRGGASRVFALRRFFAWVHGHRLSMQPDLRRRESPSRDDTIRPRARPSMS